MHILGLQRPWANAGNGLNTVLAGGYNYDSTSIRLSFDGLRLCDWTAIRPPHDCSTSRPSCSGLLHCVVNKLCGKPRYIPPPLHTVRPSSSPYTPLRLRRPARLASTSCGPMNIHDVRDRQTDRRQTSDSIIA